MEQLIFSTSYILRILAIYRAIVHFLQDDAHIPYYILMLCNH